MPRHALLLLNKAINEDNVNALKLYNIGRHDMPTEVERKALSFIETYAEQNGGKTPSYALVADTIDGFEYVPEVSDTYDYLAKHVKAHAAKTYILDMFDVPEGGQMTEFERKLNELDGHEFIDDWLTPRIESIKMRTSVREKVGTDIKTGGETFLEEYRRRKLGESFRIWKSKFSAIGSYISGNVYTVYGKSGRGKSVLTLEDAMHVAQQGANVLIWAMEMSLFEVMVRAYVSLSGDMEIANKVIDGVDMAVGFDSDAIRHGTLGDEYEQALEAFLKSIDELLPGNVTIRAVDDEDFSGRSLRDLEADIEATKADFVVIDPFYYLDYEANTSRTAGGGAAETSKKLRALAGRTQTAIVAITQAEETEEEKSDEGSRELKLPERKDVKKTKALLEDAYQLIAIDTDYQQGRGYVGIGKGRDGGEGNVSEIQYLPQYGIIRELNMSTADADAFEF